MSWASDAISSRLDDTRRRLAELESSAQDAIDKADHASDVVAAAKNAGESALAAAKNTANSSNVRAQFGVPNLNPGDYHAAKQARKEQQATAQAQAQAPPAPEQKPLIGRSRSTAGRMIFSTARSPRSDAR